MTSTRIVLNYRRGRLFTSFHHRPFIISQNSVSVIRSTTATTCIRCSSSGIVRRHLSNIDDSNSGYYSLCLMPHSVCSGWGESIFGNRSFLLKRWMVTKRQQRIEEMKSQPQGTTTATDVGHSMDVDERLRKASVLAKADELEEGFAVDTSGLYQRNMHNFLPDFNDPKLNYEEATPLFDELSNIIGLRGPISVAEYFRYALLHPTHGYYTAPPSPLESSSIDDDIDNSVVGKYDLIGARGDFTTAPEISQIFGELLCVWFVHEWRQSGKKSPLQLIELGPGNGTLMSDMLRVARTSFPDFTKALSKKGGGIRLVEQSPALRKAQAKKLGVKDLEYETLYETNPDDPESNLNEITSIEYALSGSIPLHEENMSNGKPSIPITWHVSLASVPNDPLDGPQYVLAQELFDALPVHSFQKTKSGWRERLIDLASTEIDDDEASMEEKVEIPSLGLDENGKPIKKPRFRFVLSPGTTKAVRVLLNTDDSGQIKGDNTMQDDAAPGDILEVCPEGMSLVQDIAKRINKCGGGALVIDYGSTTGTGDTIRGFSRHKQVPVLSLPGSVDITADVDFRALSYAVKQIDGNASTFGPVTQGQFLMSLGAGNRVEALIDDDETTEDQAENLFTAFERLVSAEHMGERFKVLAVSQADESTSERICPPGFESAYYS